VFFQVLPSDVDMAALNGEESLEKKGFFLSAGPVWADK
jgi:hypothetical protein